VSDTRYNYTLRARRSDETLREDDRNGLLLRAAAQGQLPRIKNLLRLGADVDFADETGFTALHHAVSSGFEDCVKELIDNGADINSLTNCGVALNIAAGKRRVHVVEILLRARADCDEAIAFANDSGLDVGVLKAFLIQGAKNNQDGKRADAQGRGGDGDLDESSDDLRSTKPSPRANKVVSDGEVVEHTDRRRSTRPGLHAHESSGNGDSGAHDPHSTEHSSFGASVDPRPRTSRDAHVTHSSSSSLYQAPSTGTLHRMLTPLAPAITPSEEHDDPILKRLTGRGYTRGEALSALEKYDYDINRVSFRAV
jgi:ankyrin repeat protein